MNGTDVLIDIVGSIMAFPLGMWLLVTVMSLVFGDAVSALPSALPMPEWAAEPQASERFQQFALRNAEFTKRAEEARAEEARKADEPGVKFESFVVRQLTYLRPKGYRWIQGVHVSGVQQSEIDHIVVGPNGIFCIEAKWRYGTVRIDGDQWTFTSYKSNVTKGMENPVFQNDRHLADLRQFLGKRFGPEIDKVTMHNIICLSNETVLEGRYEGGAAVIKVDALIHHIEKVHGQNPLPRERWVAILEALAKESRRFHDCLAPWRGFDAWTLTARDYPAGSLVPVVVSRLYPVPDVLEVVLPWGISATVKDRTGATAEAFRRTQPGEVLLVKMVELDPHQRRIVLRFPGREDVNDVRGIAPARCGPHGASPT